MAKTKFTNNLLLQFYIQLRAAPLQNHKSINSRLLGAQQFQQKSSFIHNLCLAVKSSKKLSDLNKKWASSGFAFRSDLTVGEVGASRILAKKFKSAGIIREYFDGILYK